MQAQPSAVRFNSPFLTRHSTRVHHGTHTSLCSRLGGFRRIGSNWKRGLCVRLPKPNPLSDLTTFLVQLGGTLAKRVGQKVVVQAKGTATSHCKPLGLIKVDHKRGKGVTIHQVPFTQKLLVVTVVAKAREGGLGVLEEGGSANGVASCL